MMTQALKLDRILGQWEHILLSFLAWRDTRSWVVDGGRVIGRA